MEKTDQGKDLLEREYDGDIGSRGPLELLGFGWLEHVFRMDLLTDGAREQDQLGGVRIDRNIRTAAAATD